MRGRERCTGPIPGYFGDREQHVCSPNARGGCAMAATDFLSAPLSDAEHRAELRKAVIASTVGTTSEWYDFLLYSVVTPLVFGKLFFPTSEPLIGVLEAFAIYFVGFVGRPIGAFIFGHFGDR